MKSVFSRFALLANLTLLLPNAYAAVTAYGYSQVEMGNTRVTGNIPGLPITGAYTSDQKFGRLGIIASQKVKHDMTAIAKFEWQTDTTTGAFTSITDGARESFIGLKTRWGTFQFGAIKSPYKYWGGTSYDPFANTTLEARNHGGMSGHTWSVDPLALGEFLVNPPTLSSNVSFGHDGFVQNSAAWKSIKLFGFEVWGTYSADQQDESPIIIPPSGDDNNPTLIVDPVVAEGDYTFGLKYSNDKFEFGFGAFKNAMKRTLTNPNLPITRGRKVFTQYTTDKHTISLQWENIKTDRNQLASYESDIYYVSYQYKWAEGTSTFAIQYGASKVDQGPFIEEQEVKYFATGFIYSLSKKAQIYGGYSSSKFEQGTTNGKREIYSVGMRMVY